MKKQKNTIYHEIMAGLILLKEEICTENVYDDVVTKVKKAYEKYKKDILYNDEQRTNGYGIRYKTIPDNSLHSDTHEIIFSSLELRDSVYEDWEQRKYWDELFGCELLYPYPSTNPHDFEKIYISNNIVYIAE